MIKFEQSIEPIFVSDLAENVLVIFILLFFEVGFAVCFILDPEEGLFFFIELVKFVAVILKHFSFFRIKI